MEEEHVLSNTGELVRYTDGSKIKEDTGGWGIWADTGVETYISLETVCHSFPLMPNLIWEGS